jgi:hypothetical protein
VLQYDHEATERRYARALRRGTDPAKRKALYDELFFERKELADELDRLNTARLIRDARRLDLPWPRPGEKPEAWEKSDDKEITLTLEARASLRSAIRQEKKDRSEKGRSLLTGLTGLVGALTGLVALFLK